MCRQTAATDPFVSTDERPPPRAHRRAASLTGEPDAAANCQGREPDDLIPAYQSFPSDHD